MISLNDNRWSSFEGGYRIPYDASIPLLRLEKATSKSEIDEIFEELWDQLHHQGDVGLASYYSVPHLIRIARDKNLFNYNVFGLIATIEIERQNGNPPLPKEFEAGYFESLRNDLPELVRIGVNQEWDVTLASTILSALAAAKGQIAMATAILKMEDD